MNEGENVSNVFSSPRISQKPTSCILDEKEADNRLLAEA